MDIKCAFCQSRLYAISPDGNRPAFRCGTCNVATIVTNSSYLPENVRKEYWRLVKSKTLTKQ